MKKRGAVNKHNWIKFLMAELQDNSADIIWQYQNRERANCIRECLLFIVTDIANWIQRN